MYAFRQLRLGHIRLLSDDFLKLAGSFQHVFDTDGPVLGLPEADRLRDADLDAPVFQLAQ